MILLDTGMRKIPDKCCSCIFFRAESPMRCTAVVGSTKVSAPYKRRPAWCPLHEADSDTISRQQAIDAVMDEFKRLPTSAIRVKTRIEALPPALLANKSPKVDKKFGELISRRDDNS